MSAITVLTDVDVQFISLVKAGANKKKPFPVTKADESPDQAGVKTTESKPNTMEISKMDEKEISAQLEQIKKANTEALAAIEKKHAEEKAELQKQLKVMADERETEKWIEKAKNELSHYPGKSSEDLGKMLKVLNDASPEIAKAQFEAMKAASDALKESALLKEAGNSRAKAASGDGTAMSEIQKIADALVAKDVSMPRAKAFAKALELNPGLYQKYLDENPKQVM